MLVKLPFILEGFVPIEPTMIILTIHHSHFSMTDTIFTAMNQLPRLLPTSIAVPTLLLPVAATSTATATAIAISIAIAIAIAIPIDIATVATITIAAAASAAAGDSCGCCTY